MWNYTKKMMKYFLNPKNIGEVVNPDGEGTVGSMICGDALKLSFKLDKKGKISLIKFKTFGCGSAIASSSVFTEMLKGKTLEEAKKITNEDIINALEGLPEKKIHCSVMCIEAFEAAVANYHGTKKDRVICQCFGITEEKIRNISKENEIKTVKGITNYCKAGGACGKCNDDILKIIQDVWKFKTKLTFAQKVMKIQSIIDSDIKPMIKQHNGSIDFVDLRENTVFIKLTGNCKMCEFSDFTINIIEKKLKENLSTKLKVEKIEE